MPPDSRPLPDRPAISDDGWSRAYRASRSAATTGPCRYQARHRRQTSATCADRPHRRWSAHRACPGADWAGGYRRRAAGPPPAQAPPRPRGWPDPDAAAEGRSDRYGERGDDAARLPRRPAATACPHSVQRGKAVPATNTLAAAPRDPAAARTEPAGSEAATERTPASAAAGSVSAAEADRPATGHGALRLPVARGRRPRKAESATWVGQAPHAAAQQPPCHWGAAREARAVPTPQACPGLLAYCRQGPGQLAPTQPAGAPHQSGHSVLSGRPNVPTGRPWPGWPWPEQL